MNRSILLGMLVTAGLAACVDSELGGQDPGDTARATTTREDTSVVADTSLPDTTTLPDSTPTTLPDTTVVPDTADTDDGGPDAGCRSDEACRGVLGELGPCEAPLCDLATGTCTIVDTCNACVVDADCTASAPACTRGRCGFGANGQGVCRYERTNACCNGPAACDDGDPCTTQTCDAGVCGFPDLTGASATNCCATTPVLDTGFAPAPAFQWRSEVGDAGWSVVTTTFATSPTAALYLGNEATMTAYSAEGPYAASALFALGRTTAGTNLEVRFQIFVDLRAPELDKLRVFVRDAQGNERLVADRATLPPGRWVPVYRAIPVPTDGPWTLVFEYVGATQPDPTAAAHTGVLVDDLFVQAGCAVGCVPGSVCPSDDPCVAGRCDQTGTCVFEPIPNCGGCQPADCDDGDPCTRDVCTSTGCVHELIPDCGVCTPERCNDQDPCTVDRCNAVGMCVNERIPGCGVCDADQCDDGNPCTSDRCTLDGQCAHDAIPNCGCTPQACNDGDPCTRDTCTAAGQCFHEPIPNCGCTPQACNDGDPCTFDRCDPQTGGCVYEKNPQCCTSDEACADANQCTLDFCQDDGTCRHEILPLPGCGEPECQTADDCHDGNGCTDNFCQQGACVFLPRDCDDGDPCTIDFCNNGGCQHLQNPDCNQCTEQVIWQRSFAEGENPDVQTDGNSFSVSWRVDDVRAASPPRSLRYGNEDGDGYSSFFGGRNYGRATGPVILVPTSAGGARLSFKVWMDIDDPDPEHDLFRARVLIGEDNLQVWDRGELGLTTNGQWVTVTKALPASVVGQPIRIRFTFDSVNGDDNDGDGVAVDDIVVTVTCPTP